MYRPCTEKIKWKLGSPCKGVQIVQCFGSEREDLGWKCSAQEYHNGGTKMAGVPGTRVPVTQSSVTLNDVLDDVLDDVSNNVLDEVSDDTSSSSELSEISWRIL